MSTLCSFLIFFYSLFGLQLKGVCQMPIPAPPNTTNTNQYWQDYYTQNPSPGMPGNPTTPSGPTAPAQPAAPYQGQVDPNTNTVWSDDWGWVRADWANPNRGNESGGGNTAGWGGGGGSPTLPPTLQAQTGVQAGIPVFGPSPNSPNGMFEIPDAAWGAIPQDVRPTISAFLQSMGYQGAGNVGAFGERTYLSPSGQQIPFDLNSIYNFVQNDRTRKLLQYLFGELGQPGFNRIQYPGLS